ncbi:MAG: HAD-IIIA family hydrolase [Phycisphaeraceae bacterium]|nr:HAD-IIIA family hydrolase [Phycisphaeraceae bacterium]
MDAAVFLDRDNTIIENDGDLGDPALVKLLRGTASAIASLKGLGYRVVVVSNQGGVARGKYSEKDVEAVNRRVAEVVAVTSGAKIDRFYYCPFHPEGTVEKYRREHPWRKPQPGMLFEAARQMRLDLTQSWMIGDQLRDVAAGAAAGTRTILLTGDAEEEGFESAEHAQGTEGQINGKVVKPDFVCRNLTEAVRIVAQQRRPEVYQDLREEGKQGRWRAGASNAASTTGTSPAGQTPPPAGPQASLSLPGQASSSATAFSPLQFPSVVPPLAAPVVVKAVSAPAPEAAEDEVLPEEDVEVETVRSASAFPGDEEEAEDEEEQGAWVATEAAPAQVAPGEKTEPARERRPAPSAEQTLREILGELRNQRDSGDEFSWMHILALVLQVVAVVCLFGALSMGKQDMVLYQRWLGVGLLVQMMTITLLLFRR